MIFDNERERVYWKRGLQNDAVRFWNDKTEVSLMARNWTKNEEILAFSLYCKMPFGQIHARNHSVISLAKILDRSPASVSMKMCNFARFDPALQSRGVRGLSNGSRLDEEVWAEFSANLELLENQSKRIFQELDIHEDAIDSVLALPPGETVERNVHTRSNQQFFRQTVLLSYRSACCITGIGIPALLNASHIKPWKDSDLLTERTNPQNGLCLNALHDRAFDRGLITLDSDYQVVLSNQIKEIYPSDVIREFFLKYDGKSIQLPDRFLPSKEFLAFHNEHIFEHGAVGSL